MPDALLVPALVAVLLLVVGAWVLDRLSRLPEVVPMRTMLIEPGDQIRTPAGNTLTVLEIIRGGIFNGEVKIRSQGNIRGVKLITPDVWLHWVWCEKHGWPHEEPAPPYEPEFDVGG